MWSAIGRKNYFLINYSKNRLVDKSSVENLRERITSVLGEALENVDAFWTDCSDWRPARNDMEQGINC